MTGAARIVLVAIAAGPAIFGLVLPDRGAKGPLKLIAGGDLLGYIAPCGCTKPMLGGMTRRGGLVKILEESGDVVKVENGDLTEASGRQDQIKAETVVDMLGALKYDALNLGERDFQLGLPYLRSLQERTKMSFLSANVFLKDGPRVFPPYTLVTKSSGGAPKRVAILGLLSSEHGDLVSTMNPELEVRDPEAALQEILPAIASLSDVRILLFHGSKEEAKHIAEHFPAFQMVVYSHEDDPPATELKVAGVPLVCAGKNGRRLAVATLAEGSEERFEKVEYKPLEPSLVDEVAVEAIRLDYLKRLRSEDLLSTIPRAKLRDGEAFAGSSVCRSCHSAAHESWTASKHSKALATLEKVQHEADPECVPCHVVGLDKEQGFASRAKSADLANVGCESCHGPGQKHMESPSEHRLGKAGEASCKPCHIPDHSPGFEFKTYWDRIKH